jgi:hypothetical protein
MARYTIHYACNHECSVHLIGPARSRESRIASLERGECFECYKQHSTEVAKEQAEELELPALVGTEKQVAWAETLRIQQLTAIESEAEHLKDHKDYRHVLMAVEQISNETSAKQWIEWRERSPRWIIARVLKAMLSVPAPEQAEAERAAREQAEATKRAVLAEATLRPEAPISELVAEIHLSGAVVSVTFPERHEGFRETVKSLDYSWYDDTKRWSRVIDKFAGNPADRAVEIGCMLLSHGFLVRTFDEVLRARIATSDFKPERTRWILKIIKGEYTGWFAVKWGRDEDYYTVARKIKDSKYSSPHVVVPSAQFDQVLDFAQRYDFKLSEASQEVVRQAQEDKARMLVVVREPAQPKKRTIAPGNTPPVLIVPESVEVADELRDNDD